MNLNNVEINIIVNGRKATEYQSPMDFQNYIEGRDGSNFEMEFVNNNSVDVEAILSVDGLSVTTGKPAGSDSAGYMIPARGRVSIPGWTLDNKQVAKFFFAGPKGGSYAEQSGQDDRNKGVIGAKVYGRKFTQPVFRTFGGGMMRSSSLSKGMSARGMSTSTFNALSSASPLGGDGGSGVWASNAAAPGTATLNSMSVGSASASVTPTSADSFELYQAAEVEQTLGTGFGEATDFATTQVDFERGDLLAVIELFYDDAQGLKRRGIRVGQTASRPSAFPADEPKGATPPPGWTGAKR